MVIKILHKQKTITNNGLYKDGTYFELLDEGRVLVDDMVEEIYLSTRFIFLSSNKLHSASIHELKNDLIKRDDKYPPYNRQYHHISAVS